MKTPDVSAYESSFTACTRRLDEPDDTVIREALREMPRRGAIEVLCGWDSLSRLLATLGEAGCFAIEFKPDGGRVLVTGLKGKAGPCYETGRSARYLGVAAAALDDDGHLLVGDMRVCEKTGGLYSLPPYRGLVAVTPPDPRLLAKMDSQPELFNCNTFEKDTAALAVRLHDRPPAGPADTVVLYAGPFRLLILDDGTMLPRGEAVRIPAVQRLRLAALERLIDVPAEMASKALPADSFPARYAVEGALCLLSSSTVPSVTSTPDVQTPPVNLVLLDGLSSVLRNRLQQLIRRGDAYFILGGSDPRDANGCCPSDEVGDANRLVEAGVLVRHQPPAHPDACATTVYAFAGEMSAGEGGSPVFTRNDRVRDHVANHLARRRGSGPAALQRTILGTAVGILVMLGLASAVLQTVWAGREPVAAVDPIMAAVPAPGAPDGLTVVFFQGPERCEACATMIRLVRETVKTQFAAESDNGRIACEVIDLGLAQHASVKRALDLPFSTVGLVRYQEGRPREIRMLTRDAWRLVRDEPAFCEMLAAAIKSMEDAP